PALRRAIAPQPVRAHVVRLAHRLQERALRTLAEAVAVKARGAVAVAAALLVGGPQLRADVADAAQPGALVAGRIARSALAAYRFARRRAPSGDLGRAESRRALVDPVAGRPDGERPLDRPLAGRHVGR